MGENLLVGQLVVSSPDIHRYIGSLPKKIAHYQLRMLFWCLRIVKLNPFLRTDSIYWIYGYEFDLSNKSSLRCTENYIHVEHEWECGIKCYKLDPVCSAWSFNSPVCTISTCKLNRLIPGKKKVVKFNSVEWIYLNILLNMEIIVKNK